MVGSSATQELSLYNDSDCSLHYRLIVDQAISGPYNDEETVRDVPGMHHLNLLGSDYCFVYDRMVRIFILARNMRHL